MDQTPFFLLSVFKNFFLSTVYPYFIFECENIIEEIKAIFDKALNILSNFDKIDWNSAKIQI